MSIEFNVTGTVSQEITILPEFKAQYPDDESIALALESGDLLTSTWFSKYIEPAIINLDLVTVATIDSQEIDGEYDEFEGE